MASALLESNSELSSADEPVEHEDKVDSSLNAGETKAEVKCKNSSGSVHDQIKKTRDVYDVLKNSVIESTKVFENSLVQLNAKEQRLIKLSTKISSVNVESAIRLNVGGIIYQTSLETLSKYPGSLLAEMFSEKFDLKQGKDGSYFIDRDGSHFRHILNYLRSGTVPAISTLNADTKEILHEAEYYGLVGLVKAINSKLDGNENNSSEAVQEECESAVSAMVNEARTEVIETGKKLNSFLNLLESNIKVLDDGARHHKEISMKLSNVHFSENIKIDVGGRIFKTTLKTLRRESESVLAIMFSEKFDLKREEDESFFIDRDGALFHHILNYLRDGKISEEIIEEYGSQIQVEAEFYELSELKKQIHNYNHIKLNVGGREFVAMREVLKKYPESKFRKMLSGEKCIFITRQDGSFHIERDGTKFQYILEYLRCGTISDDVVEKHGALLVDDAAFYNLPSLIERINNYHNVKMIIGGQELFVSRTVLNNFPNSMFGKMLKGERGNYLKRNDGSFVIQHGATNLNNLLTYLSSETISDDVIKNDGALLLNDAEFYMLPDLMQRIDNYYNVKLIFGGQEYVESRKVLLKFPNSLFGKMLKGEEGHYVQRNDGSYIIQYHPKCFYHILAYLRSETLSDDVIGNDGALLLEDAEFCMLPGLIQRINNYHNVKMIIGGKEYAESREVLRKFPNSMFGKMLKEEEGDYVKRNDGSYVILRDATTFIHILTFLRSGTLSDDVIKNYNALLLDDAEFYMLPDLKRKILPSMPGLFY